jgi:hypothetical protein
MSMGAVGWGQKAAGVVRDVPPRIHRNCAEERAPYRFSTELSISLIKGEHAVCSNDSFLMHLD